jgi:predicted dithiol-disulfide oxidoreductase (DUF899 family)
MTKSPAPDAYGALIEQSRIIELDPPRKLTIAFGASGEVSFHLVPEGNEVLLTVIHRRLPDRETMLKVSAGWHTHLDILAARAAGKEPEPFWDCWSRLKEEYGRRIPAWWSSADENAFIDERYLKKGGKSDDKAQNRDTWRMAGGAARSPRSREGAHAARRRAGAPAPGATLGSGRKGVRFETDEGSASLAGLFRGNSQLLVYHFMFGPDYTAGCPSCSAIADGFNGFAVHLANHDVMLWAVSRAPLAKLQAYKRRMGWSFPWASSSGGDFNFDFDVSFTKEQQREGGIEYNYQREPVFEWSAGEEGGGEGAESKFAAMCGTSAATYHRDRPGMSAFALEDGAVYHSYSTYARGLDSLWGMYQWLDRAPKGRNETGVWWRRHDEYNKAWARMDLSAMVAVMAAIAAPIWAPQQALRWVRLRGNVLRPGRCRDFS